MLSRFPRTHIPCNCLQDLKVGSVTLDTQALVWHTCEPTGTEPVPRLTLAGGEQAAFPSAWG